MRCKSALFLTLNLLKLTPYSSLNHVRKMLAESPDRSGIETFFWGNHPRTSERIEATEAFARTHPNTVNSRGNQDFESRTAAVRVANAQWDAYLGRTALARSQIDRTVRAIPERPEKALVSRLLYAHVVAAASNGLASRGQTSAATDASNQAVSMYENVISEASRVPSASNWVPVAYRSLGFLYYTQRDSRGRHCEAKAALEKYLELAPSAADRTQVADRLRELSC